LPAMPGSLSPFTLMAMGRHGLVKSRRVAAGDDEAPGR